MQRECPDCGLVTDLPEGSCRCPVYHGRTGDGYCPIFVDGFTREETILLGPNGGPPIFIDSDMVMTGSLDSLIERK